MRQRISSQIKKSRRERLTHCGVLLYHFQSRTCAQVMQTMTVMCCRQTAAVTVTAPSPVTVSRVTRPGSMSPTSVKVSFFCFVLFFCFSTGLVRLYIAGLPLRSCRTIGAPSVQGSAQCPFFSVSGSSRIRTHILVIRRRTP